MDPDFHRGDGVAPPPPPRHSGESRNPRPPKSTLRTPNSKLRPPPPPSFRRKPESTPPQIHTSHSQFQTPSPPALRDSASTPRRRSTTELAEARKGRGPRFSSGRRGSPPVIPANAGIHVPPKSTLRTPNSKLRPPLRETPTPQTAPFACPNVLDKQNAAMLQMTASTTESQQRGPGGDLDMPVLIGVSLPMSRLMDPSIVPRSPPRGSGM